MNIKAEVVADSVRQAVEVYTALIGVAELLESLVPLEEAEAELRASLQALAEKRTQLENECAQIGNTTRAVREEHRRAAEAMHADVGELEKQRDSTLEELELAQVKLSRARKDYEALPPVEQAKLVNEVTALRAETETLRNQLLGAIKAMKVVI